MRNRAQQRFFVYQELRAEYERLSFERDEYESARQRAMKEHARAVQRREGAAAAAAKTKEDILRVRAEEEDAHRRRWDEEEAMRNKAEFERTVQKQVKREKADR